MTRLFFGVFLAASLVIGGQTALGLQTPDEYVVQPGDSLGDIARRFELDLQELIDANPQIRDPDTLTVGQVVFLPGGSQAREEPPPVVIPEPGAPVAEGLVRVLITAEPILEGFPVVIDGVEFRTDSVGQLRLDLTPGEHQIAAPEVYQFDPETRVVFARWSDEWAPSRPLTLRENRNVRLSLGLYVQHFVSFEFVDGLRRPIDRSRIDSVEMMNSNGEAFVLSDEGEEGGSLDGIWLTRNRLRRTGGVGLLQKPNVYTLRNVYFDGLNAVQQGADEFIPTPGAKWTVPLLVYPFEVEVRSFGFNRLSEAKVALISPEAPGAEPIVAATVDGRVVFDQVPRGDFELELLEGGFAPRTPVVFTGPKTEHVTVVTPGLLVIGLVLLVLAVAVAVLFYRYPPLRIPTLVFSGLFMAVLVSLPSVGAVVVNPLSAEAVPIYDSEGSFVGMSITVTNESPLTIAQVYCQPDFELRIIGEAAIWQASYESHDFHDVEMGECREHRVAPGISVHVIAPGPGQEWSVTPDIPLPEGRYQAFVRVFAIPAEPISLNLSQGLAEDLQFVEYDPLGGELPFTNAFED